MKVIIESSDFVRAFRSLEEREVKQLIYQECDKCHGHGQITRYCGCCNPDECESCGGTGLSKETTAFGDVLRNLFNEVANNTNN